MHECYAMQILEKQREQREQRKMVTKSRAMKYKDYVRKSQLDRVFYIKNFLDTILALELLFTLEWWPTPRLE